MLYLIKRGPKPAYHLAPFHPVVICDSQPMADEEVMGTSQGDTMWVQTDIKQLSHSWRLVRWQGLDIDYRPVVCYITLPDGRSSRMYEADVELLLPGAIWWSSKVMPKAAEKRGVIYAPDKFTQQRILDRHAGIEDERRMRMQLRGLRKGEMTIGFSISGIEREKPKHWPEPIDI